MQANEPRPSGLPDEESDARAQKANPLGLGFLISEPIVLLVILINAIGFTVLEVKPDIVRTAGPWIEWVDYACILYFVIEMLLKLRAFGLQGYLSSNWNKYDMVIVLISTPVLAAPFLDLPVGFLSVVSLFRLARLLRIARLIRYSSTNNIIVNIRGPIYGVLLVSGIGLLADSLHLDDAIEGYVRQARAFLIVMSITWLVATLFNIACRHHLLTRSRRPDSKMDAMAVTFMNLAVGVLIWAAGFVIALETAGQNAMTVLAGLGIGGLAIAFAAQDTVANVIGGLLIFLQRPFKVGDLINVNGIEGWIETIGFRSFAIRKYGGELVHVPNKSFVGDNFVNIDQRKTYLICVPLVLRHTTTGAQLERAKAIMLAAVDAQSFSVPKFRWVDIDGFDAFGCRLSLQFHIQRWSPDQADTYIIEWTKITECKTAVMVEVMKRFEQEGIQLAVPVQPITANPASA